MWSLMVAEVEIGGQSSVQLRHCVILVETDIFVLDAAPKAFAEDVVEGAASTVHADLNVGCEQADGEGIGRELCALVGVEDLGPTGAERLTQGIETEDAVQGVGKLPSEHITAVPVDDSDQIHEATQQRHIGDVSAPDLVDMRNRQVAQKIGIALVPFSRRTAASPGVDSLNAHQTHQTSDSFAIDDIAESTQMRGHLGPAIEGCTQELLVNQAHQMQVQGRLGSRLIVEGGPIQPQQLTLPSYTQDRMLAIDHAPPLPDRSGQLFFSATQVPS